MLFIAYTVTCICEKYLSSSVIYFCQPKNTSWIHNKPQYFIKSKKKYCRRQNFSFWQFFLGIFLFFIFYLFFLFYLFTCLWDIQTINYSPPPPHRDFSPIIYLSLHCSVEIDQHLLGIRGENQLLIMGINQHTDKAHNL